MYIIYLVLNNFRSDIRNNCKRSNDWIKIFGDQVSQLRLETKAKLQQTVADLRTDLSQLTEDQKLDTEPLKRQISALKTQVHQLETAVRTKEIQHKSKRCLVEKKIEAAQKDLDRFDRASGRNFPSLDKEFECPVCFEVMGPPRQIFQCPSGHLICDGCKNQGDLRTCHVCRAHLGGEFTRNLAMERVVRTYLGGNSK